MQTATSETESKSFDLSICVHHYTLRAPCPKGQGNGTTTRGQPWKNVEPMMRSMHWQSEELLIAMVKVVGHYANHVDVLFPSPGWRKKTSACPRAHANIGRVLLCSFAPIGRQDPSTDIFKGFGRMCSSPPSFHLRSNQSRNHVCAWYC